MSTQQDIYATGSESRPPMLNKENYVPWSSRLLRYAKSRPNEKLIHNFILNGPYVRRMIVEPSDAERDVNVNETFHEQTDDELSERELKQIEADDQVIQTILLVAQTTTNVDGTSTTLIPGPVTTEEKAQNNNDVKARSMLLMALEDCKSAGYLSTNEVNTANGVSTANTQASLSNTQASTASTQVSTANLKDATVYAFLASQPNMCQLVHEDLVRIHEGDLEEMNLKWQLALLSIRTKTGRKIIINGSDTAGYDKSKVECFNCHKLGHFAREYRQLRNHDSRNRNQDNSRRTVNVEENASNVMVAINGAGFEWSIKTLKTQLDDLRIEFNKSEFNLATYKRGLASVEEQLVFYKKNEVIFCEQITILKRDNSYKDSKINMLKSELKKLKQEKESNQLKIENSDNASKSLEKLIESQIPDKSRKGVGFVSYNVVPPPPTGLFSPSKLDFSNSGLEEFQHPEFECYGPKTSNSVSEYISNEVKESTDAPLVKEMVSDDKLEKKTVIPTVTKIEFVRPKQQEKPVRILVKYAELYKSQGNQQKEDQGYVDSECSRHMTGNMSYLSDFKEFDGGYVTFGEEPKEEKLLNRVLVVKPHNKTPYELFRGRTPTLSFMKPFGCHVTILNTLDHLGKFDGKSDDGFFVGYSLNSMVFRVHKQVLVQDMLASDAEKKDDGGVTKESGINDQERPKNSTQDVNTTRPSINTVSTNVNTSSLNINTVSPSFTTAPFKANHTDLFGDETEVDMSNISTTYLVPYTPNTRIYKDYSLDHVIGDM
uniref:Ribonuclease H-like domain-containing protein n=1 Tax=Tanacetum cinerariifolium TaxID=118510 RepID=A0A6L2M252_TANCI|nr:ribonuclease H-like domain-containing protein [Tanacetum cinerariifolium]